MSRQDEEIERLKASMSCAALLERLAPVWRLDHAQSTRRSLKYRRGAGEIVIVNHEGRGWWDPLSDAKGDIFTLVRRLDPALSFTEAVRLLRGFAGIAPAFPLAFPAALRPPSTGDHLPAGWRWQRRASPAPGSPAWHYLTQQRGLPEPVLAAAVASDAIREGPNGSAWFAHRDNAGCLTGIEMRGADYRNFSAGGHKTLFRLTSGPGPLPRITICESAIDALSLAAIEALRPGTLYAATAGGMGPATITVLQNLLQERVGHPHGLLVAATDADAAGQRLAARLAELAAAACVPFAALLPPNGLNDWNDALLARMPAR